MERATISWRDAMRLLLFDLPLRNARDIMYAEAILYSEDQFRFLRFVLSGLLEENIAALGDEKNANPGAILANALLGRFDLAITTSFAHEGDCITPVNLGAGGTESVHYRPNPIGMGSKHLAKAYYFVLKEYATRGTRILQRTQTTDHVPYTPWLFHVKKGLVNFCRMSRTSLKTRWLPQLMLKPGLTGNTMSQSLMDDLKLFADFMMKRVGRDDYFLYATPDARTAVTNAANELREKAGNGDWRVVARNYISEDEREAFGQLFEDVGTYSA